MRLKAALPLIPCLFLPWGSLLADEFYYIDLGSTWKYFRGLTEASEPDLAAWRQIGFDDSGWASGPAPFGFGDPPFGTDLSLLSPPMRGNYWTLFLRKSFDVVDPARVSELRIYANYDDGFVAWLNGHEVLRANVDGNPGDPVYYNGKAKAEHEQGTFEEHLVKDHAQHLVAGKNVLALQVFNVSLTSSDLKLDLDLFDPSSPDMMPPEAVVVPAAGSVVRTLARIEVTFSEDVTGMNAADLIVAGKPATGLAGSGRGPYLFTFTEPSPGAVGVSWAVGHGIQDLAVPPNNFAGGSWSYTLDPDAPAGDLVLSEFLAANGTGLLDEDGDSEDWIEVHNRGSTAVPLAGWALTDDPDDPGKWVFPARTLDPGKYLLVFASGKDRRPAAAGNLHANFKLNAAGEYLGLYNAESPRRAVHEYAPQFPPQRLDRSYGLDGSGSKVYFESPTPEQPNQGGLSYPGFVKDPRISVRRGIYSEPLSVEIFSDTPGASIRYTLDGSQPTPTKGTVYSGPIQIAGTPAKAVAILRAIASRSGFLPSNVVTSSYLFWEHVKSQPASPAGFPSTWGGVTVGSTAADYAMDPRITSDPEYAAALERALLEFPSVSIATEVQNLFDPQKGIYSNPAQEGANWERPASAEFFFPQRGEDLVVEDFQIDCGLRIQGGTSTSNWKSYKLSMRLLFRDDYGAGKLRYPLFPGSRIQEFDNLVLDAHLNLTYNHPDHGQRVRSQYVRDAFVSDLQNAAAPPGPHDRFVNLFLNGLYWGLYDLHERPDETFAGDWMGGAGEEYDVFRHSSTNPAFLVSGNTAAWNTMMNIARSNLALNAQYEALQDYLDVPNFVDYMLINIWAGNDDWPHQNYYAARRRMAGAGYRFFSWDAEHVLKDVTLNILPTSRLDTANSPGEIFNNLREQNAEFRLLVADRVHKHFFNGGTLYVDPAHPAWDPTHPERNVPASLYMRRIAETEWAIVGESARWGDIRRPDQPYTKDLEWTAELNWLKNTYFPARSANVLQHLKSAGLYPAVGAPVFQPSGGTIGPGSAISMSLPAGTTGDIYYTTDGSDPRKYGTGSVSPSASLYEGPVALSDSAVVKARVLGGTVWSALREAKFTVAAPLAALRLTEIMYNPLEGPAYEFVELQNTGSAALDLSGLYFSEGLWFVFPENFFLGAGEFLVLVFDPAAFASRSPGVEIGGVFEMNLGIGGERITLLDGAGNQVLSVEYGDGGFWPLSPDGFGYSLVLADPSSDPDDPRSWRPSAGLGGSPGSEDPEPAHGGVIVSEVLPRGGPNQEDAIELHNFMDRDAAIGGWWLSDSRVDENSLRKYRIPDGAVIPAGGYKVFYQYQFNSAPGDPRCFELNPLGGGVYLAAAEPDGRLTGWIVGARFDGSAAGASFGWHAKASDLDFTALQASTFGADFASSVEEFRTGPGGPNAPPRIGPVVLNEIQYHPYQYEDEFIELHNASESPVSLHDPALGLGWMVEGILSEDGAGPFQFPAGASIGAGGYLLVVGMDPGAFRQRNSIPAEVPIFGPYGGALDNAGERVKLFRPELVPGEGVASILADQVRYNDKAPWPPEADGMGPSLERIRALRYGNDPENWGSSLLVGGTPGKANSRTPGNKPPVASFAHDPKSGPAPLTVSFDASGSRDPDGSIAAFEWTFGDGGTAAGSTAVHVFSTPGTYTVALRVTDDLGAGASANGQVVVEAAPGGGRIPGDANSDSQLDISDCIALLGHLFLGGDPLPCGDGTARDPGNKALLNSNGDQAVDLSDVVYALTYLFLSGPAPVNGTACVRIQGCPETCAAPR